MKNEFQKDVFAIFVGGFLGALFAHSFGYFWFIGIALGGAVGYLARLLTEPGRVIYAARLAFRRIYAWEPKPNWRRRLLTGFYAGVCVAGPASMLGGILFTLPISTLSSDFTAHQIILGSVALFLGLHCIIIAAFCLDSYDRTMCVSLAKLSIMKKDARKYNALVMPWRILCFLFMLLWCAGRFIITHRSTIWKETLKILMSAGKFLKIFIRLVHTEALVACGLYSAASAMIIFFTMPHQPIPMTSAALIGAVVGAIMRRVVLYTPAEAETRT